MLRCVCYHPRMKPCRSRFVDVRGLRYHLREWGTPGAPRVFMLHGWMDVSASFQFVVDAFERDWHVIAPDWRGFGASARGGDTYWFPDYLADLDALLRMEEPDRPARLVGHSMGGNVACLYAGVRPARVGRLVALDAFGLADHAADEAPGRYEKWLAQLERASGFRDYPDFEALAERLRAENPRLAPECAAWLARQLGEDAADGSVRWAADPAHRRISPVLYRRGESEACWRRATAPVMWIEPADAALRHRVGVSDDIHASAQACFRDFRLVRIDDAGHNLHHDQPGQVAAAIEAFLVQSE